MTFGDKLRELAAAIDLLAASPVEWNEDGLSAPDHNGLVRLRLLADFKAKVREEYPSLAHRVPDLVACAPGLDLLWARLNDMTVPLSQVEASALSDLIYINGERIKGAGMAAAGVGGFQHMRAVLFERIPDTDHLPASKRWRATTESIDGARSAPGHLTTVVDVANFFISEFNRRLEMDADGAAQSASRWR